MPFQITVAIIGNETLDTLQEWAEEIFTAIPNKEKSKPGGSFSLSVGVPFLNGLRTGILVIAVRDLPTVGCFEDSLFEERVIKHIIFVLTTTSKKHEFDIRGFFRFLANYRSGIIGGRF